MIRVDSSTLVDVAKFFGIALAMTHLDLLGLSINEARGIIPGYIRHK